jgi:hypothetical protein
VRRRDDAADRATYPAPPGGHFTVYVDPNAKTASLVPGA